MPIFLKRSSETVPVFTTVLPMACQPAGSHAWSSVLFQPGANCRKSAAKCCAPDARLLTLVGPLGIRKMRMSIQAGESLLNQFADGMWFVGLAVITKSASVLSAIAHLFGITESASTALRCARSADDSDMETGVMSIG